MIELQSRLDGLRECLVGEKFSMRVWIADNFLEPTEAERLAEELTVSAKTSWHRMSNLREQKTVCNELEDKPLARRFLLEACSEDFVAKIGEVTGSPSLRADKSLYAGGLSMMKTGDFLKPHIDNSHNADGSLYRRLNLLYYPLVEFGEATGYGGALTLFDAELNEYISIDSIGNRLVLMETNNLSWHGVSMNRSPHTRYCVSCYYFSDHRPITKKKQASPRHATEFRSPGSSVTDSVFRLDAAARSLAQRIVGVGRGRRRVNKDLS